MAHVVDDEDGFGHGGSVAKRAAIRPVMLYAGKDAEVAELVDAHDSKSCSARIVGSIPTFGTIGFIAASANAATRS